MLRLHTTYKTVVYTTYKTVVYTTHKTVVYTAYKTALYTTYKTVGTYKTVERPGSGLCFQVKVRKTLFDGNGA